jgi:hypothetical protein
MIAAILLITFIILFVIYIKIQINEEDRIIELETQIKTILELLEKRDERKTNL